MNKNRQKKEKIVAKLKEKIGKAKGLVFTNYQGLTHVQLEKLKNAVKPFNADLVVTKNTLLFRSLQISRRRQSLWRRTANLAPPAKPLATHGKSQIYRSRVFINYCWTISLLFYPN